MKRIAAFFLLLCLLLTMLPLGTFATETIEATEETAAEKKEKKFDEKAYEKAYEDALNNKIYGD